MLVLGRIACLARRCIHEHSSEVMSCIGTVPYVMERSVAKGPKRHTIVRLIKDPLVHYTSPSLRKKGQHALLRPNHLVTDRPSSSESNG